MITIKQLEEQYEFSYLEFFKKLWNDEMLVEFKFNQEMYYSMK